MARTNSTALCKVHVPQVAWWARGAADVTFKWHQSEPFPLPVSGDVLAADVAVATSGLLRLLIVSQLEPSKATVLKISGDPTAFRPDGMEPDKCASLPVCCPSVWVLKRCAA